MIRWFSTGLMIALGVWFGMNIYNDRPLLSNPFAKKTALEKMGIHQNTVDNAKDIFK